MDGLRLTRRDLTWMAVIAAAALLISNLPRLWATLHTPPGLLYIGTVWAGPDESWMAEAVRQAALGHLASARAVGAPDSVRTFDYAPYLLLGWPLGRFEQDPMVLLGWYRLLLEPLALGLAGLFVTAAVSANRVFAYFVGVLAGGLGGFFLSAPATPIGSVIPMDVVTPSFNVLNSLHMQPNVSWDLAGIALFAWGLVRVLGGSRVGVIGLLGAAMSAGMHPWELLPCLAAAGIVVLFWSRTPLALGYVCGGGLVALAVVVVVASGASGVYGPGQAWAVAGSAKAEAESIPGAVAAYLLIAPFAVLGGLRVWRSRESRGLFVAVWVAFSLVLGLLPVLGATPLHRTLEGRSLALGVLAANGLTGLPRRAGVYLAAACVISPLLQLPLLAYTAQHDRTLYLATADRSLATRLGAAGVRGAVMSDALTMEWVVSYSELRSPGHDPFEVGREFDAVMHAPAAERARLVRADGADYVYWGAVETRRYGSPPAGFDKVMGMDGSYLLRPAAAGA